MMKTSLSEQAVVPMLLLVDHWAIQGCRDIQKGAPKEEFVAQLGQVEIVPPLRRLGRWPMCLNLQTTHSTTPVRRALGEMGESAQGPTRLLKHHRKQRGDLQTTQDP